MAVGKLPAKKPEEGDETEKPGEDGSVDKPGCTCSTWPSRSIGMIGVIRSAICSSSFPLRRRRYPSAFLMNQIIQMTVMQAITDMKSQVDDLTEANILNYTASLVGQTVTLPVYDKEGKLVGEKEGVVTGTGLYNGQRVIFIGDEWVFMSVMACMTVIWMIWFIMSLVSAVLSMVWFCSWVTIRSSISSKDSVLLEQNRQQQERREEAPENGQEFLQKLRLGLFGTDEL